MKWGESDTYFQNLAQSKERENKVSGLRKLERAEFEKVIYFCIKWLKEIN